MMNVPLSSFRPAGEPIVTDGAVPPVRLLVASATDAPGNAP